MPPKLGQHFLRDRRTLRTILQAAELSADDIVLEIGAGKGILSAALASGAKKVFAIEKDKNLCALLQEKFSRQKNIQIICADVLKFNPAHCPLPPAHYKIVANIPYYLTGRLLRKIFEEWPRPKLIVLMLQKEVAERICSNPPKMSLLSASIQFFAEPKIISRVPKTAFHPPPKVESAIIKLTPKPDSRFQIPNSRFFEVVRAGFGQPRKLLASNLSKKFPRRAVEKALKDLDLSKNVRAAELSIKQWLELAEKLENG